MFLSSLCSSFLEFIANSIQFFCETFSPISKTYFDFLDAHGFVFYQSLIISFLLYCGLMTSIFYLRRFLVGDHKTNMIAEFATTQYEVRAGTVSKIIIFSWNMFMFVISLVLSILLLQTYYDVGQTLTPPLNLFIPSEFINLSMVPTLHKIAYNVGNVSIPALTIIHFLIATKFLEWIDTAINMSMGRSVILLHFWHHATIVTSFSTGAYSSACITLVLINSMIHVVMYLYYALSVSATLRPYLNMFKIFITITQIIQFLVGIGVGFVHLFPSYHELGNIFYNRGPELANNVMVPWGYNYIVGDTMTYHIITELFVISYLVLFVQFFYKTYRTPKVKKQAPINEKKKQ